MKTSTLLIIKVFTISFIVAVYASEPSEVRGLPVGYGMPLPSLTRPRQMEFDFIIHQPQEQPSEQPTAQSEIIYYVLSTDNITREHLNTISHNLQITHLRVVLGDKPLRKRSSTALADPQVRLLNEYFPNIVDLNLSDLGDLGAGAMIQLSQSFPRLTHLNLANTHIYDTGFSNIVLAVFAPNLVSLDVSNTGITPIVLSHLFQSNLLRLRDLDLSHNRLTGVQSAYLTRAPFRNTLRNLNIQNTGIAPTVIEELKQQLPIT